jgi:hypothetical protein
MREDRSRFEDQELRANGCKIFIQHHPGAA